MFFCYFKLNLIGLSENKKYAPVIKSSNQKFLSTFNRNRNISNWGLWWQEVWLARYMQLVGHVFVQQNDEGVFRWALSFCSAWRRVPRVSLEQNYLKN